ncbi:unnamed protein product [Hermetia illucens]|uniref:CHK kinase-like domain-containing protein n=2 Tax=Hermetia illucens TaxID=343691 RepID=A0A7R8Z328_HERIL|nr:uncharacterized protein LOC119658376 isoform X2 [Hermetia illucens]XP_037921667.1 uncharacterized protein LOC119658376 isoform X2 [Hermetia illucens]XP_037921668.1 uncharacterized protein LOC119658376 isoform X2 [Hermetia illucens]XP_037921669.1 uncharacterized protein LOC119658376 isoform X2 [Hermetia illucens]XP_037921671.1 uncharacterized protein LOC119658376 isoform X2 [Hermetia illucens]CAD7091517.1 unnamed protein product [Hermetia illucens]
MIIQKNNYDVPDFLNEQFFKKVVENKVGSKDFELTGLNFSMGCDPGENHLSNVYRVQATYNEKGSGSKVGNFFVKCVPLEGDRKEFAEMDIFEKEKLMYCDIIPQIESCLVNIQTAPKCYYVTSEPMATMVFEDMKATGYDIADRVNGVDINHCKVFLTKLGQYHAGSMILLEKEPSLKETDNLKNGIFSSLSFSKSSLAVPTYRNLSKFIEHASKWSGYEKIVNKLQDYLTNKTFLDKVLEGIRISPGDIVAIVHEDCWVNNILFQYKGNSVTDALLIDFQGCTRGSIGLDIIYFFAADVELNVLRKDRDQLIEDYYYPALRASLEQGSYKNIPTLEDVKNEVKKKVMFGLFGAVLVLPLISLNKKDKVENTVEAMKDKNKAERIAEIACSSKRAQETLKIFLEECDSYGLLN